MNEKQGNGRKMETIICRRYFFFSLRHPPPASSQVANEGNKQMDGFHQSRANRVTESGANVDDAWEC